MRESHQKISPIMDEDDKINPTMQEDGSKIVAHETGWFQGTDEL